MAEIPVYLFTGFLDAGKTSFIKPMLSGGEFTGKDRTLFLNCEEGEEEYDPKELAKWDVSYVSVEEETQLSVAFLKECERRYKPDQVLIEYNGMWVLPDIQNYLPKNWVIYQIVTIVDATTFDVYVKNMGSLMMEKLTNADLIVFNRCTPELKESLRKRNLKMVNRRAEIYLEGPGENDSEPYDDGSHPPFDLNMPVLDLADEDFGIWYVDVMDHPERYEGHTVRFKGQVAKSDKFPKGSFVAGRFAMVCCAQDTTFLGMICLGPDVDKVKTKDWVTVTATVKKEHVKLYKGDGPVLYTQSVTPAQPPKEELVSF